MRQQDALVEKATIEVADRRERGRREEVESYAFIYAIRHS